MRDITARSRLLFWALVCAIVMLSAFPSMLLIEKAQSYRRFLAGWNPGTLRQLTVGYVPHRAGTPEKDSPQIRYAEFRLSAPRAKKVELSGTFNQWQPLALKREGPSLWKILLPLPKGAYCYVFSVDGKATLDPRVKEKTLSAGRECSVRQVR